MIAYVSARRLSFVALLLAFVAAHAANLQAQEKAKNDEQPSVLNREISLGELQPTPEMWFYQQQMRANLDPKLAVRRRAEFRGTQRQNRLASSAWFGQSKSRPTASGTPFTDSYSSSWTSNTANPYAWSGVGNRMVVVRPARPNVSSFDIW